ncbi:alcohol dehydrogenase catalytic domain-containing protein [Nonomuraea sp. NPDC049607]|uniref:zinc-binding dehydrogenase n=1 Tax=Nonomuraea sp. NPDC049607 TaxID=3154732 RepID=UPI003440D111
MRGVVLHAPGDVRVDERTDPAIVQPTDAIIRVTAACVCGSDLWPYRGIRKLDGPAPMGHEYVGVVEEVGSEVTTIKPGQFVVGSFCASDNTCEICRSGYQSACVHRVLMGAIGTQAEYAVAAEAGPGRTVAVVGDGAVGLCAVPAARQLGTERVIAMSRHEPRQNLALRFGATDIVTERGDEGVARIKELTGGLGAHSVVEAVGTQESMTQAIGATRPGGHVGFVGVSHDLALPLDQAAEAYRAMDERRARAHAPTRSTARSSRAPGPPGRPGSGSRRSGRA